MLRLSPLFQALLFNLSFHPLFCAKGVRNFGLSETNTVLARLSGNERFVLSESLDAEGRTRYDRTLRR
jgi:hypothetical protein